MNFVYPPLVLCSSISTLLPFLSSTTLLRGANRYSRSLMPLLLFFSLAVITETILYVLSWQRKPNAWIFHFYTLIEYLLITIVLASWQTNLAIARLMRLSISMFLLFFVLAKITGLERLTPAAHNSVTRPVALLLLGTFAFLTLLRLWRHTPVYLARDYRFWILLAMAFYYSTSLVLFAFMSIKDREFLIALFKIHAVINIVHNILFTIGVFHVRRALQPTAEVEVH